MPAAVTAHPTAAWTAQQLREAFPWDKVPLSGRVESIDDGDIVAILHVGGLHHRYERRAA